jgi:large subunit ribosomal protein L10
VNRDQKATAIAEIADQIKESEAVIAVDYRGITVAQVAGLRTSLRDADASFRVVKNTLTERAADQAEAQQLKELLVGPTALMFVRGDAAAAAKAIADFQRSSGGDLLPFKGGLMNGEALDAAQVTAISKLPSRQVLYGQLVGIVASPITGLARSLNGLVSGLAIALGGVLEKKESGEIPSGDAPAAPAAEAPAAEAAPATDDDTTDQDADAPEAAVSAEEPAEGPADTTTETQEN